VAILFLTVGVSFKLYIDVFIDTKKIKNKYYIQVILNKNDDITNTWLEYIPTFYIIPAVFMVKD
jgi:hypothetical protein